MAKLLLWREDLRRGAGKLYMDLLLPRSTSLQCTSVPRQINAISHSNSVKQGGERLGFSVWKGSKSCTGDWFWGSKSLSPYLKLRGINDSTTGWTGALKADTDRSKSWICCHEVCSVSQFPCLSNAEPQSTNSKRLLWSLKVVIKVIGFGLNNKW